MSETKSPLARLVLFMVCLSIAGAFIAGVHYVAVDLPQLAAVNAPTNERWSYSEEFISCAIKCKDAYNHCLSACSPITVSKYYEQCRTDCKTELSACRYPCPLITEGDKEYCLYNEC